MRLAGTVDDQHDAATFVDYLLTQDISAKPEKNGTAWEIWIRDEDRVAQAKDELQAYLANRSDPKYRAAGKEAERLRRAKVEQAMEARRNIVTLPRSTGAFRGRRPLTMMLLAAAAVVFVTSDAGKKKEGVAKLQITQVITFQDGRTGYFRTLPEIRRGEYWRIFSPILLHFGILHFVFNMYWLFVFGSEIEARRGTLVLALLIALSSAAGNLAEFWWSGPTFGGMSGVNYGLFGYLLIKSKYQPWLGFMLPQSTVFMMIAWFFVCMTGAAGPVANACHALGLVTGIVFAAVPTLVSRRR